MAYYDQDNDAEYAAFCATRDPMWEALFHAVSAATEYIRKTGNRDLHRILEATMDAYERPDDSREALAELSVAISMAERPEVRRDTP